jgi:hypothetical protein
MAKKASVKVWGIAPASSKKSAANEFQKLAITKDFESIIEELKKNIKPLPEPQQFNHCIDVFSKWRGNQFYIMQKYKTGTNAVVDYFDEGIARLEYVDEGKFHIAYFRHTGQWFTIAQNVLTEDAKKSILEDPWFHVF